MLEDEERSPTVPPALARKLIVENGAKAKSKRLTREATLATSELLRLFIVEARSRAGIEAECETEGRLRAAETDENNDKAMIRADHITKIAAELLMDFS